MLREQFADIQQLGLCIPPRAELGVGSRQGVVGNVPLELVDKTVVVQLVDTDQSPALAPAKTDLAEKFVVAAAVYVGHPKFVVDNSNFAVEPADTDRPLLQ